MEDLLKNIPEKIKDKCIIKDGILYCPETDINGKISRTAQEVIDGINKPEKEPSEQEQINAQLLEEIAQQKIVNSQLMQEIATLKGGNANV